jgi:adenosylcobinamide-phosphate synthase
MNILPARLSALLIASAARAGDGDPKRAFRIMWRDRTRTDSPNAGWTMAAMAGALGVQLENPDRYVLGDPVEPLDTQDIERAIQIINLSWGVAGVSTALASTIWSYKLWRRQRTALQVGKETLHDVRQAVESGG